MSNTELSTAPRMSGLVVRSLTVALVLTAIILATFGPRGLTQLWQALSAARLHAPRVDLLASAPLAIKVHLGTVLAALALATWQMVGLKGRATHRIVGWTLAVLLLTTAVTSLFIHDPRGGLFNPFQIFSVWTLIVVPVALFAARRHNVRFHARAMAGLYFGGMIFAGMLTFLPGRLMWRVFFG